jgi:hypothetical protein
MRTMRSPTKEIMRVFGTWLAMLMLCAAPLVAPAHEGKETPHSE